VPQMEACLPLPGAGEKTVLLAAQPIEIGHEHRALFTSADLHPCKQAEDALRQSEERSSKALQMAPGPVATIALEGFRILYVNQIFASATGWRLEEAVRRGELDWRCGAMPQRGRNCGGRSSRPDTSAASTSRSALDL
jgi:PAS domain-containing protein